MSTLDALIYEVVSCVEVLVGLVVNTFIMVVNLRGWWTSRKLKPYDKIVVNLGLCRVFLLFCFFLRIINRIFKLSEYSSTAQRCAFRTVQLFFDFANLWFAMWLCLLYFIKITIFTKHILTWVKLRIPQFIFSLTILTYVVSFIFGFIFALFVEETADVMDNINSQANKSVYKELRYMLPSYFFGHLFPFILVSISTLLLIRTITLHIRKVKTNITGFKTPRLDAHITAIRSAVLLELMTLCNLLATIFFRFDFYGHFDPNIGFMFLVSYPLLHSVVIIAGNVKLKGACWGVADHVKEKVTIARCPVKQQIEK